MRNATILSLSILLLLALASPLVGQESRRGVGCRAQRAEFGFGWSGAWTRGDDDTPWREAISVDTVFTGTAADGALEGGDRILRVNDLPATSQILWSLRRTLRPGDTVRFLVARGDEQRTLTLTAGEPVQREGGCGGTSECDDREP